MSRTVQSARQKSSSGRLALSVHHRAQVAPAGCERARDGPCTLVGVCRLKVGKFAHIRR